MSTIFNKGWIRLDTAALIFPATMNSKWSNVFRLSATLKEDIEVNEYYDSFYSEEPMRPSWCPLKELPEKMKYCNGTYNGEVKGWNNCIDEILNR